MPVLSVSSPEITPCANEFWCIFYSLFYQGIESYVEELRDKDQIFLLPATIQLDQHP